MTSLDWVQVVAIVVGPGTGVYVGIKTALNGIRNDVKEIKRDTREIRDYAMDARPRLERIERRLGDT